MSEPTGRTMTNEKWTEIARGYLDARASAYEIVNIAASIAKPGVKQYG